jgi:hypothetical protein
MRRLLALLLLALAAPACALTPEEAAYIAERNRAVAALEQKWTNEAHDRAIASLTPKLKRIVGPPPKGVAGETYIIPDTLCCGVELGKVDAVVFGEVAVTTTGLLQHWLNAKVTPPPTLDAALADGEAIYAIGLAGDPAVEVYATLPITKPAGATTAVAHLALGSQAGSPQDLGVIVRKGERVFLTFRKVAAVPALQVCEDGLARDMKPADAARTAGKTDESFRLEAEASAAYARCWRTHAREAAAYPAILRQAQELADAFAD